MKKLLAFLLALCMVMSLAACGAEDKDEEKEENKTEAADSVDKDENDDKGDKADKDDKEDEDDKEDKDDNTDADDTPVIAPETAEYNEFLEAFCDVYCGELSQFEKLLPETLWNIMRMGAAEEFGYTPTKDEVIETIMSLGEESEFADEATYDVLEEKVADDESIGHIEETLQEVFVLAEIEEAYELRILWTIKADGKTLEYEDVAYAVYFDGEWTLMSKNYIPYIMDMEDFDENVTETFGESFV